MLSSLILGRMTKLGENREGGWGEWHFPWSLGTVTEER